MNYTNPTRAATGPSGKRRAVTRLIHLTDLHLSSLDAVRATDLLGKRATSYWSWRRRRRHVHRREVLDQLAEAVRRERPDLLIVSGDLVQIGLDPEIREAAAWLAALAPAERILFVPGNHDVYAGDSWPAIRRHWRPWLPEYDASPRSGYPLVREVGGLRVIGASSACVTPVFSARGALGSRQRQRIADALGAARAEGVPAMLALHHPPLDGMARRRKALADRAALQATIDATRPAVVLCGHLHHNRSLLADETRVFVTASASSVADASYRVFEWDGNSAGRQMCMRLMTRDAQSGALSCAETAEWTLENAFPETRSKGP